jgi:hypothetical protein
MLGKNIRINNEGALEIRRVGQFKTTGCRFANFNKPCCDLCPSFKEPVSNGQLIVLELCCGDNITCSAAEFLDMRGQDVKTT